MRSPAAVAIVTPGYWDDACRHLARRDLQAGARQGQQPAGESFVDPFERDDRVGSLLQRTAESGQQGCGEVGVVSRLQLERQAQFRGDGRGGRRRRIGCAVRTTTARTTSPFFTLAVGVYPQPLMELLR